jgi:uncharacterized membrane protein
MPDSMCSFPSKVGGGYMGGGYMGGGYMGGGYMVPVCVTPIR